MATLTNSAVISSYTFPVGPSTNGSATSNTATTSIEITNATVTFTKANLQEYVKPGSTTTITYSVTNLNPESITKILIQDPLFTTLGVNIIQVTGGTIEGDVLTMTLGSTNELVQDATAQVTLKLEIAATAPPDSEIYDTTASGTFTIATSPEATTVSKTSKGHLEVNSAIISITKTVSPSVSTITSGNLLTFTIAVTNSGNVDATIPLGNFTDTWAPGLLTNVTSLNPKFKVSGNSISNSQTLSVPSNTTATLIYTGIASSI